MREVFGVKFYSPFETSSKGFLGYRYIVRIGHEDEANIVKGCMATLSNKEETWKIYKLKVLFLVVRSIDFYEQGIEPDQSLGLLVIEDGGKDKILVDLGEHALMNGYELDEVVNRLISQEGFKIHFQF
jgi:hypothetical protein